MEIKKGNVVFTAEDEKNLVVKKYTDEELEEMRKHFKQKRNRRRVVMACIILLLTLFSLAGGGVQYACYIALCFMIFLVAVYEYTDRTDIKAELHPYYSEIQIDKVLPREEEYEGTLTPGIDLTTFFPVEGRDTTSGYKSIFYIDQDQYLDAKPGKKVKISVKGETL